jgi:hypothetical protein
MMVKKRETFLKEGKVFILIVYEKLEWEIIQALGKTL